jgi:hypothetical protein
MKKLKLLFFILIGLTALSCSTDEPSQQTNFFKNAYLEIHTLDGTTCYADLFLTSGTATIGSDNSVNINYDDNVIVFNDIRMNDCQIRNPATRIFDRQNGYNSELNTISVPGVYLDTAFNNAAQSSDIIFVELKFTSNTALNFEIYFEDGTVITESYSGTIEIYRLN